MLAASGTRGCLVGGTGAPASSTSAQDALGGQSAHPRFETTAAAHLGIQSHPLNAYADWIMRHLSKAALAGAGAYALSLAFPPAPASAAACSGPYVKGDVFASIGDGKVDVFTPNGTPVCTLDDGTGALGNAGSSFDTSGNFYVTNFGAGGVSKFNNVGGLVSGTFMANGGVTRPESIAIVSAGLFRAAPSSADRSRPQSISLTRAPGSWSRRSASWAAMTRGARTGPASCLTATPSSMTARARSFSPITC
jgi:hypothetical protein